MIESHFSYQFANLNCDITYLTVVFGKISIYTGLYGDFEIFKVTYTKLLNSKVHIVNWPQSIEKMNILYFPYHFYMAERMAF